MLSLLVKGYFLVSLLAFLVYLKAFLQDSSSSKMDYRSWLVAGLAALFWPIVLPLSCLERWVKRTQAQSYATSNLDTVMLSQYSFSYSLSNSPMAEVAETDI
ncbi:MAG: hypothetical protein HC835_13505 [Oscillatoriales cyanobacterium RM2_1_1]|nr:hypothetical protein [Oscillatoriales cyanobacterium RM2_1_1]